MTSTERCKKLTFRYQKGLTVWATWPERRHNWSGLHTSSKICDTKCLEVEAKGAQRANKINLLMTINS